ncbi:hypothetical protein EJV47_16985 [Hymenobacter gummosus]|uniref:DUF4252 domain-containing protein n=1 Tax=Hymenobacter gummosus TaxID=1776032 RepID=A0A3S0H4Z6_9BACT|nr:hypothetical protein [Hymenobacter gummosus]RTQ48131.1 hypothetical protein EJV47_16985 [Hymenobacter gummosus]
MKYPLLLLSAGLSLAFSPAQAQSSPRALDARNGFLDAKFGMPASELEGVRLTSTVGAKQVYERVGKLPTLGGNKLSRVHYTFYNNQLCSIMLNVAGKSNNDGVLRTLQQAYGTGTAEGRTRTWEGRTVSLVFGTMGQDQANGVVSVSNKALVKQMQTRGAVGQPQRSVLSSEGQ